MIYLFDQLFHNTPNLMESLVQAIMKVRGKALLISTRPAKTWNSYGLLHLTSEEDLGSFATAGKTLVVCLL